MHKLLSSKVPTISNPAFDSRLLAPKRIHNSCTMPLMVRIVADSEIEHVQGLKDLIERKTALRNGMCGFEGSRNSRGSRAHLICPKHHACLGSEVQDNLPLLQKGHVDSASTFRNSGETWSNFSVSSLLSFSSSFPMLVSSHPSHSKQSIVLCALQYEDQFKLQFKVVSK